jgi:hypothetical protein
MARSPERAAESVNPETGPIVELTPLVAPVSDAPWSDAFVAQTLEVFFVCLRADLIHAMRPIHASSLRLGMTVGAVPGDLVLGAVARYGLAPLVVHSTSWRSEPGRVILTYVAAVAAPDHLSPYLAEAPVDRADLARGGATAAPAAIAGSQVLEHAIRHLSWLVGDDPAVGEALAAWRPALEAFVPEPFRNL